MKSQTEHLTFNIPTRMDFVKITLEIFRVGGVECSEDVLTEHEVCLIEHDQLSKALFSKLRKNRLPSESI